jgi:hypothetical protein
MAALFSMKIPVFVRFGRKEIEIGEIEIETSVSASGKIRMPSSAELRKAIRKAVS